MLKGVHTKQQNNFGWLRLMAAGCVLVSHSYGLLNKGLQQPQFKIGNAQYILSDLGLYIFFTISGYLVTKSFLDAASLGHYLWKRFLRIVPALAVVNAACIIMGAFITSLPAGSYFANPQTALYFFKNSTLVVNQFLLPGVFTSLDEPSVNASIWTILVEVKFYLLLAAAGMLTLLNRKFLMVLLLVAALITGHYLLRNGKSVWWGIDFAMYFNFGIYFFLGCLFWLLRTVIIMNWYWCAVTALFLLLTLNTPLQFFATALLVSYAVLYIGQLKAFIDLRGNDFSYGFYLYAFPVQQLVLLYGGYDMPVWWHICISSCITLVLAVASWKFIEQPALAKKDIFIKK
ncbi:MAG: acyltransferase [Flavihumibacter sp.]|nr:acyltransferase [Flavihumibacter sp.]